MRCAGELIGVHRNTAILYFRHLREIIAYELDQQSDELFGGEIEVNESYFGGTQKGKRGRGANAKTPVFGLLIRGGKVYTQMIPDASSDTLIPIIESEVVPDSIVYSDGWKGYNALDVKDFLATVLLSSLSSASILLIATIELAVVFGLMGVINLAHGEFIMIGAYTTLTVTKMGIPYILSIPIAVMMTAFIGAIVEILIIRRLYGRIFDTMLATWRLIMIFYQLAVLIFGTVTPGIGMPQYNISIGKYSLAVYPLSERICLGIPFVINNLPIISTTSVLFSL